MSGNLDRILAQCCKRTKEELKKVDEDNERKRKVWMETERFG